MPRIRTIKPEFPQSESMGRVSREARLLFLLLFTLVDDEGRTRGYSRMLASLLYPYDDDAPGLIDGWLEQLERENCIRRYEVSGAVYLEITNWLKHQKIDKPSKSRLPSFEEGSRVVAKPREEATTDLVSVSVSRTRDLGPWTLDLPPTATQPAERVSRQHAKAMMEVEFKAFMAQFPNPIDEDAAKKAYGRARKKASSDELLNGAMRYAAEKQGKDPQYIKSPRNWLDAGSWKNPARPATATNASRGLDHAGGASRPPSRAESAIAGMCSDLTEEDFSRPQTDR
ncbi:hypothetical protein [Bradyrhizobium sp. 23]|uniref:hypothetical protein n=1 Tax=Bradyrhizobium sp. 23 TaxID=2782667 RepID=UPI001FF77A40|nr:hypothetical protein [Bradyrhizobium sp. 23]MCK1317137.1 hypothetical protein [Bradyrhizobium sp. 23]